MPKSKFYRRAKKGFVCGIWAVIVTSLYFLYQSLENCFYILYVNRQQIFFDNHTQFTGEILIKPKRKSFEAQKVNIAQATFQKPLNKIDLFTTHLRKFE